MNRLKHTILTALALAMSIGAWAQQEVLLTTVTATGDTSYSQSPDGIVTVTLNNIDEYDEEFGWLYYGTVTVEANQGYTITRCVFRQNYKDPLEDNLAPFTATIIEDDETYVSVETSTGQVVGGDLYELMDGITSIEVYGYATGGGSEPVAEERWDTVDLTHDATFSVWTLDAMPDTDAVLLFTPAVPHSVTFAAAESGFSIAGGAATVSLDGQAATLTEGALQAYPGQTVTLTAANGYKFRSATASETQAAPAPAPAVVTGEVNVNNLQVGDIIRNATGATGSGYITLQEGRYKMGGNEMEGGFSLSVSQFDDFDDDGYTINNAWGDFTPVDANGQDGNAWIVLDFDSNGPVIGGYTVGE